MRNRLSTFERREEEVRRGGGLAFFFFLFFFWCVCILYRGALGKNWKRKNEIKLRGGRGRRGVKEKDFSLFLNFFGQDMVYVHISLRNLPTLQFPFTYAYPITSHSPSKSKSKSECKSQVRSGQIKYLPSTIHHPPSPIPQTRVHGTYIYTHTHSHTHTHTHTHIQIPPSLPPFHHSKYIVYL